jgi:hypothetical protein
MENQIVCPNCKKTIMNNVIVEEAAKGQGSAERSVTCDCGESISYWRITAQLREQKSFSNRFLHWMRDLSHSQN